MSVDNSKEHLWRELQKRNGRDGGSSPPGSGNGGNGSQNSSELSVKDYVDAKTEAIESRLLSRLEKLADKSTIWSAVATGTAIILAVLAFAGDRFDAGMNMSELKSAQSQRDFQQDSQLNQINDKLDALLKRTEKK